MSYIICSKTHTPRPPAQEVFKRCTQFTSHQAHNYIIVHDESEFEFRYEASADLSSDPHIPDHIAAKIAERRQAVQWVSQDVKRQDLGNLLEKSLLVLPPSPCPCEECSLERRIPKELTLVREKLLLADAAADTFLEAVQRDEDAFVQEETEWVSRARVVLQELGLSGEQLQGEGTTAHEHEGPPRAADHLVAEAEGRLPPRPKREEPSPGADLDGVAEQQDQVFDAAQDLVSHVERLKRVFEARVGRGTRAAASAEGHTSKIQALLVEAQQLQERAATQRDDLGEKSRRAEEIRATAAASRKHLFKGINAALFQMELGIMRRERRERWIKWGEKEKERRRKESSCTTSCWAFVFLCCGSCGPSGASAAGRGRGERALVFGGRRVGCHDDPDFRSELDYLIRNGGRPSERTNDRRRAGPRRSLLDALDDDAAEASSRDADEQSPATEPPLVSLQHAIPGLSFSCDYAEKLILTREQLRSMPATGRILRASVGGPESVGRGQAGGDDVDLAKEEEDDDLAKDDGTSFCSGCKTDLKKGTVCFRLWPLRAAVPNFYCTDCAVNQIGARNVEGVSSARVQPVETA